MRRGPGGGLVVTMPTIESAIDAVMVYLIFVHASLDEILEVRLALEERAAELAADRLTEEGVAGLRASLEREKQGALGDPRELHGQIASMTANPAIELFVELLTRSSMLYTPDVAPDDAEVVGPMSDAHQKIVESIVSGDAGRAAARMRRHLEAEADYVDRHKPERPRLGAIFVSSTGESKLAESIARRIFAGIVDDGWRVAQPLGSEGELMERYGVSRAILREAVRMLEFHQITVMRRGPGGGLFVAAPGIDATADAVAIYLERRAIRPEHLFEIRTIIELKVLDRVIENLDDEMIRRLAEAHEVEVHASPETFPVYGHDLHVILGELSGNRVLALLTDVVVRLSRSHNAAPDGAPANLPTADVVRTHERIIDAIKGRDAELARHRMRRHLSALVRWTR